MKSRTFYFYGLLDKATNKFFYIGKTEKVAQRLRAHGRGFKARPFLFVILDSTTSDFAANRHEANLIQWHLEWGHPLLNKQIKSPKSFDDDWREWTRKQERKKPEKESAQKAQIGVDAISVV